MKKKTSAYGFWATITPILCFNLKSIYISALSPHHQGSVVGLHCSSLKHRVILRFELFDNGAASLPHCLPTPLHESTLFPQYYSLTAIICSYCDTLFFSDMKSVFFFFQVLISSCYFPDRRSAMRSPVYPLRLPDIFCVDIVCILVKMCTLR